MNLQHDSFKEKRLISYNRVELFEQGEDRIITDTTDFFTTNTSDPFFQMPVMLGMTFNPSRNIGFTLTSVPVLFEGTGSFWPNEIQWLAGINITP